MNAFLDYLQRQRNFVAEENREGVFLVRRAWGGYIRPTGSPDPYIFPTKGKARDAIRLMNDGPLIAGEWEIYEQAPDGLTIKIE